MKKVLVMISLALVLLASLVAQSITVLSPNGGENWLRGSMKHITWNAGGWTGTVRLVLHSTQPPGYGGVIAWNVPSSWGTYAWKVGELKNTMLSIYGAAFKIYKVRVIREYRGGLRTPKVPLQDESDNTFSIQ